MMATLNEEIDLVLQEYAKQVWADIKWSTTFKAFKCLQVRKAVARLLVIAKDIRNNYHFTKLIDGNGDWREAGNIIDDLVAQGQSITSYLWCSGLRDKITDKIEAYYGINFNGLKVYRTARHNTEGHEVFVAFYIKGDSRVTIIKDAKLIGITEDEFNKNYTML